MIINSDVVLTNEEIRSFAAAILPDIKPFINRHLKEYQLWLEEQRSSTTTDAA